MAQTFARPQIMEWNGNRITDHNRGELSVDVESIESKERMADGTLRKHVIAKKHTFSCSWEMLPDRTDSTVDGFWGGNAMRNFYLSTPGPFTLRVITGAGNDEEYQVMFSEFSHSVQKRGRYDFWTLDVTMEEV